MNEQQQQEQFLNLTAQIDALNSRLESLEARAIVSIFPQEDGSINLWRANNTDGKAHVILENSNQ